MNDSMYQSHFQNYSHYLDSASAMRLAYHESAQPNDHVHTNVYSSGHTEQSWVPSHQKAAYPDHSYGQLPAPRPDSQLYASEFADPSSNLELMAQDLNMSYPAYSSSPSYSVVQSHPEGQCQLNETVAGASTQLAPEPMMYRTSPPYTGSSTRIDPEMTPDSFSHSWQGGSSFHVSPLADTPVARYSPYTVKSQRRASRDANGPDTPLSPLSLARSKQSSTSPSPGPLTPAIGNMALQPEFYASDSGSRLSSQEPSRNMSGRNDEVDPDRPYPCGSCRMAFARQHDLTRHTRVHSGETPYYCHGCRQGFRRSDARSRHWGKEAACLALHQQLVEGTEEGRKLQKSLLRLGDKAGRVGTATFRVHKPMPGSMRGVNA